ncbi:MAG: guanylate cyclase [Leptospiraceae bacterium]|nr:MAG: guanylate cyclase [Leptospiraceae bacterium]
MNRFIKNLKSNISLEEFKDENFLYDLNEKNISIHYWSVIIFTIVYLLWLVFDFILEQENFYYFFSIRAIFALLNILNLIFMIYYTSREDIKLIVIYLLNFTFVFFIAFSISLMFLKVEKHFIPYIVGYSIPVMGFGILYFYPIRYYLYFVIITLSSHHIIFYKFDLFSKYSIDDYISGYFYLLTSIAVGIFTIYFKYSFFTNEYYLRKTLKEEEEKSEELLKNIFPDEIILELKKYHKVAPKLHQYVTVLFIDFEHFTSACETLPPEKVIFYLNEYFSYFDEIVEFYNLEKIKTIGDGYLAVAGVPKDLEDHALVAVQAAINIKSFVINAYENQELPWRCRIGLHSGPVISGVIGKLKYAYDVFGDTVNIASRMEAFGIPNSINVSEATKELIKNYYNCKYNATLKLSNGRLIRMYEILSEK